MGGLQTSPELLQGQGRSRCLGSESALDEAIRGSSLSLWHLRNVDEGCAQRWVGVRGPSLGPTSPARTLVAPDGAPGQERAAHAHVSLGSHLAP